MAERTGIASGGNWIVDRVKTVDRLPGRGLLANIRSQQVATGGAPPNVLFDLRRLGAPMPLAGYGVVGDDADGRLILDRCRAHGLDTSGLAVSAEAATSYSDVMNEEPTGERMFFHYRGANALFGPEHVDTAALGCRIFHLGYLLLLDRMDEADAETGTVAARFLRGLRAAGIRTSVDVVSEDSDRFRAVVPPALRHTDYLIVNEIETGRIVGRPVRDASDRLDGAALAAAAEGVWALGDLELLAVHMPEGVYLRDRAGVRYARGSLQLPEGFIKGSVGAGDAFCAGLLHGLHEGWSYERMTELAVCCAAACLADASATGGVGRLDEVLALARRFPSRAPPVRV